MNKPDWSYWSNLARVSIAEACALSCDVDPKALDRDVRYVRANEAATFREIDRRKRIATSHALHPNKDDESSGVLHSRRRGASETFEVTLANFRAWGESLPTPFIFPDFVPRAAPAVPKPAGVAAKSDKTMREDERENLLRIIHALHKLAEAKNHGGAQQVERKLVALGFRTAEKKSRPGDDTISKVLKAALGLRPDYDPNK